MTLDPASSSSSTLPATLSFARVDEIVAALGTPAGAAATRVSRPVHVLYGGAHLFDAGAPAKIGDRARAAMAQWGADDAAFGRSVGVDDAMLASVVAARVRAKLTAMPVESMCIDFEDGYGPRSDEEEDRDAVRTAEAVAQVPAEAPTIGIRVKSLSGSTTRRSIRTLDLFLTTFARASAGTSRPGFTVTLPKVSRAIEVATLVEVLTTLEASLGIPRVDIELMIETPQALVDESGAVATRGLVLAGRGRTRAVHLGAYDLTSELGVTAGDQRLDHPYCDFARSILGVAVGDIVGISDGATTLLPIAAKGKDEQENAAAIHHAWAAHATNVRRALEFGIWQGWDLHPAQLPARYGALHAYFLERRDSLAERLAVFVARATRASRVGQVFDDAATAQGLVTFFLRGLACGALDEADLARTTLTLAELERRSFADIMAARA